jgi:hypothetical protein
MTWWLSKRITLPLLSAILTWKIPGRAMAQAIMCLPLTAEARVCASNLWTKWHWNRFFSEFCGLPASIIPPRLTILMYHQGMNKRPVNGSNSETRLTPLTLIWKRTWQTSHSVYAPDISYIKECLFKCLHAITVRYSFKCNVVAITNGPLHIFRKQLTFCWMFSYYYYFQLELR